MPDRAENGSISNEARYLGVIRSALAVCRDYRPKFGKGRKGGYALEEFQALYRADCFYSWFGLDSPLLYAAHRAAGGITSVYRQIGTACEKVLNLVVQDCLGLTESQAAWSYTVSVPGGKTRRLSLDARIPVLEIPHPAARRRTELWMSGAAKELGLDPQVAGGLRGAVFEIRQGYKSKDAKRQNADVANAANAYANGYLPVVCMLSAQIDDDIAERYMRARWLLLRGLLVGDSLNSTYSFFREVLGYDLAAFFGRHQAILRKDVEEVLEGLLR